MLQGLGQQRRGQRYPQLTRRSYKPVVEILEERCLLAAPVIDPIQVQLNLPAGKSLIVPISAADPAGGLISYTLTPPPGSQGTATHLTRSFVSLTHPFVFWEVRRVR